RPGRAQMSTGTKRRKANGAFSSLLKWGARVGLLIQKCFSSQTDEPANRGHKTFSAGGRTLSLLTGLGFGQFVPAPAGPGFFGDLAAAAEGQRVGRNIFRDG